MSGWPVIVLGGTGYVAGELLRLLAAHPRLELSAAVSDSRAGQPVGATFGHLASHYGDTRFASSEVLPGLLRDLPRAALFSAAPHGVSAALVDRVLDTAAGAGAELRVVDVSADYRYARAGDYAEVYGHPHGAPQRLAEFTCAVPEHLVELATPHVAHPGCFATALTLSAVPLLAGHLVEPDLYAAGITGSTGSGRTPSETTHHPLRHSNLYAYNPLRHRHAPEVERLVEAATRQRPRLHFVPHSGPFTRGIQVTLQARLREPLDGDALRDHLRAFYAGAPFVRVVDGPPKLKDVVGSNYCHLGAETDGNTAAVFAVIDNLVKGAAGGALQWMNRLLGWPEETGLTLPATGWT